MKLRVRPNTLCLYLGSIQRQMERRGDEQRRGGTSAYHKDNNIQNLNNNDYPLFIHTSLPYHKQCNEWTAKKIHGSKGEGDDGKIVVTTERVCTYHCYALQCVWHGIVLLFCLVEVGTGRYLWVPSEKDWVLSKQGSTSLWNWNLIPTYEAPI